VNDFLCFDVSVDAAGWYSARTALVHRVLTHYNGNDYPVQLQLLLLQTDTLLAHRSYTGYLHTVHTYMQ